MREREIDMIKFGKRIEPMVDRFLIETSENVSFRNVVPENRGEILAFDKPWEAPGSVVNTVLQDGETVKLYYRGYPLAAKDDSSEQATCLAVSTDGVHFERCAINEFESGGTKENNVVYKGVVCHNFEPFYDTNPDCKPEERYKAIAGIKETGGLSVYGSADGIHWKPLCDEPVITDGKFDSPNMAFWDDHAKVYRAYFRYMANSSFYGEKWNKVRAIRSATSPDFIHWSPVVDNQYIESEPQVEYYTNAARCIPGAEHVLIAFPMRMHSFRPMPDDVKIVSELGERDSIEFELSDCVLITSRDGIFWDKTVQDAWIAPSMHRHDWSQRNYITAGGIAEVGDYFYVYTTQRYEWEDDGIWAYAVPRYRFISLYAEGDGGSFTTKDLEFETDDIYLNFSTSAYGYVKVTVLDEDGKEFYKSDEQYGNEISRKLTIEGLKGKKGKLVIELSEAHLYAIGSDMRKK